jgi:hypothetical protein
LLDTEDLGNYTPDNVWNDAKLSNAYLTDLYAGAFSGWPLDGGNSDECIGILGSTAVQPNTESFKYWPYEQVRDINLLLEKIDQGSIKEQEKKTIMGQAYFMRAWHYFKALRLHGGVPIVDHVQTLDEDLYVKRNTSAECFDFIIGDLDKAESLLPARYMDKNFGRIDQCVVASFKSRVLLYKASPQFNPNNPYDNAYIEEAYTAAKYTKELCEANGFGLILDYTAIFETKKHAEAIFATPYSNPGKTNGRREDMVRPLSESKGATGGDQPTWGLLEAYPMKDGKRIGTSDKYVYDLDTFWENRDPRFKSTIVHNGALYELSGKSGRRQYTTPNIALSFDAFGEGIQGEFSKRTGAFCKKGIMEELDVSQVNLNDVDWVEIRFAEILFNYAEMANEKGEIALSYEVLKQIRKRAGIESGIDGMYGLKIGMNREEMRKSLLDEKRIEFAFEGQRFWDLRRHRMFHTYLHGQRKYGILANLKESVNMDDALERSKNYTLMPEEFSYEAVDLQFQNPNGENQMHTPDSYYFFPISKDEIEKNSQLEQNEGWGGSFKGEL